ncbi:uncharacterized mitochondrial protein AtMg00810-like [Phragmites australis]|uniref:uncharacterized mitochondrial protein AtMg00810-like n=1 Tax=Phragmites australis TaxID=29695 RepID=UPI002D770F06|nr:uncharacterized mitochondrial protein AtMg00810-like [Phragmites australis]
MQEEIDALVTNRTQELVPHPCHTNVVTGKWVFRHKFRVDSTLERYKARRVHGAATTYLLLYIEDIILMVSSDAFLLNIVERLRVALAFKDLNPVHCFLGIQVTQTSSGSFLSQVFTEELLECAGMSQCKPAPTPIDTAPKLAAAYGEPVFDPAEYRSLAGGLWYLTMTRPYLAYAVQQFDLTLHASPSIDVYAYSDTDWTGCPDTRRSTSGFCEYLGDSLVSCIDKATIVYYDNISIVYMASNPVYHKRTMHIELDIHFVREKVSLGRFKIQKVCPPTDQQFANVMKKGLSTKTS